MKIVVDRLRCTSIGICESLAPDYFEIDDESSLTVLKGHVDEADIDLVEDAVGSCPTIALQLLKE